MKNSNFDLTWFSLNSYKRFETMSTREWAGEICNREYLYNDILSGCVDNSQSSIQERINNLNGIFNEKEKIEHNLVDHLNKTIAKEIAINGAKTASINPLKFFDIWQIRYFYKDIFKKHWLSCKRTQLNGINNSYSDFKDEEAAFSNVSDTIKEENFKLLSVNLKASDAQIKSDFSAWLNYVRKQNKRNPPKTLFKQAHFNQWVKYMCIPYIDLYLIAKLQNTKIYDHILGELLFPDEIEVDLCSRVRKVTHVKAMNILKNNTSSALHNQADNEDAAKIVE